MKMKILTAVALIAFSTPIVYAGCVGPVVNGQCMGTEVYGYGNNNDSQENDYQGSSGTKYQYDMSNGSDRNRYSIDLDAQRRDQMSIDTGRKQDRSRGQYGGGVYND